LYRGANYLEWSRVAIEDRDESLATRLVGSASFRE
jgi:hypothetical protein